MSTTVPDDRVLVRLDELQQLVADGAIRWGAPEESASSLARQVRQEVASWSEDGVGDGDSDEDGPQIRSLAELLEDPELLRPPTAVAPRFAWAGRVTLMAAREKRGKSTLAAACAGAVSRGRELLGEQCRRGSVLWLALEEHPADLVRKLVAFEASPEAVFVVERLRAPLLDLLGAVEAVEPNLVVVDTLPALAGLLEETPEPGSSADWTRVMNVLTRIARDNDAGLLLLHHADKLRGKYRDSTAIGAGVDVIVEMEEDRDHPGVRKVSTRARWKVAPWSYRLEGEPMDPDSSPELALVEGGPTIREQIIAHVHDHPGTSQRQTERAVTGRSKDVRAAVHDLLREGVIRDLGDQRTGRQLHPPQDPHGHAVDAPRTHLGRTSDEGASEGGTHSNRSVPPGRTREPPDALDDLLDEETDP